jgi:hypothetical protein
LTAGVLEELYQELRFGRPAPVCLYIEGAMVKRMGKILGKNAQKTTDGKFILDHELYMVTEIGTFLVE